MCVPLDAAKDFIKSCITAAGASESHADDLAEVLVAADNRGHFSHGLNRLGIAFICASLIFEKLDSQRIYVSA